MNKTEELQYYFKEPKTYGWIEVKLTDYLITHIWNCINDAHGNAKSSLIGHVDKSLVMKDKNNILFDQVLKPMIKAYGNKWGHGHYKIGTITNSGEGNTYKYSLEQFWVNYQNQHEFNPIHNHNGVYSFAAWLKIPTDYQEQNQHYNAIDANGSFNSAFCFHYVDSLGSISTTTYEQRPDMEGMLLFFPARLNHEVYPYYNCDEQRISISGNVWMREPNVFDKNPLKISYIEK